MTYTIKLGKPDKSISFAMPRSAELDLVIWTEPVTFETDDRDEIESTVREILAAHPEFTRAQVSPVKAN